MCMDGVCLDRIWACETVVVPSHHRHHMPPPPLRFPLQAPRCTFEMSPATPPPAWPLPLAWTTARRGAPASGSKRRASALACQVRMNPASTAHASLDSPPVFAVARMKGAMLPFRARVHGEGVGRLCGGQRRVYGRTRVGVLAGHFCPRSDHDWMRE
jgi:hypothetical protein